VVILLVLKPETYCVSRMKDLRPFYTPRGYNSCFKRPLRFIAKSMWHSTRVSHYTCNPSQKKNIILATPPRVFSAGAGATFLRRVWPSTKSNFVDIHKTGAIRFFYSNRFCQSPVLALSVGRQIPYVKSGDAGCESDPTHQRLI
jgi:hypothetical protein